MSDMKKLLKNESKFFVFSFVGISVLITLFYQIIGGESWRRYTDELIKISNGEGVGYYSDINKGLEFTIVSLSNAFLDSIYVCGFWMLAIISLLFLARAIYKRNRSTREFISTLPIKRSSRYLFDTIGIIIVVCGLYIILLVNIASTWVQFIKMKEIAELNLNIITQMKNSVITAIVICVISVVFIAFIALINSVVSNGIMAIVIGIFDSMYLVSVIFAFTEKSKNTFLIIINKLIVGLYDQEIWERDISEESMGWIVLFIVVFLVLSIFLIALGFLLTNKINYAKSGLIYLDTVRYLHIAVAAYQCIKLIKIMIAYDYKWYSITCFAIIMTAIIFGINYLITPRTIKN